jgi:hypothetical protein
MGGFQITHVVGDSPLGPFVGAEIAAPPTHYNPHAYHFDDGSTTGLYVLYTNGGALRKAARVQHQLEQARMARGAAGICNGMEENHTHHPLAFVMPDGNCTTALCAIYGTSPQGPWNMRSVDSSCTVSLSNAESSIPLLLGVCFSGSVFAGQRSAVSTQERVSVACWDLWIQ